MSLATLTAPDTRPTRRRVAKSPKPRDDKPQKISAYISPESAKRLGIHSTMEGRSQSAIIDMLIQEHLRRWVVQDRGRSAVEASSDDQVATEEIIDPKAE